jgi:hypothetical protein
VAVPLLKTIDFFKNASIFAICCDTKTMRSRSNGKSKKKRGDIVNEKTDLLGTVPGSGPRFRSWLQEERRSSGSGR